MISITTRLQVRARANYLCEYCHSPEEISAALFEVDHIQPKSLGGKDELANLALACQRCNRYRYNFIWTPDALKIVGLTPIARATIERLDLNDDNHNEGFIVKVRRL
jgi:hypothetical protein